MKLALKNQWIENLRSGRFKQGHHRLRRLDNTYCCLGVLCETLRENGLNVEWVEPRDPKSVYHDRGSLEDRAPAYTLIRSNNGELERNTALLSDELRALAGITVNDMWNLTRINDMDRLEFRRIADWIQERISVDPEPENVE